MEKIQAEHLRIGNLVQITDEMKEELWDCAEIFVKKNELEVSLIENRELRLYIEDDSFEFNYEDINPIKLTEEWLIKLGFEKEQEYRGMTSKWDDWRNDNINGLIQYDLYEKHYVYMFLHHRLSIPFHYVHQLQNLYFALTGKELTLK